MSRIGAGKTTAMRAIVGVAAMDSGAVRWGGEPIGLSVVIILASTVAMAWLAGTVHERALLRTGRRLKVRQVLRSAA